MGNFDFYPLLATFRGEILAVLVVVKGQKRP
ncbi:hypothetical protein MHA_2662 [Mannheimia haemolytica PHL213]|nr:hypothetical protein MHA_2614 [Mannheimia haemolytica PHL213]EDN75529.1 hypothetical protein MHA_2662 [Mannheimia haemolytica PHL213]